MHEIYVFRSIVSRLVHPFVHSQKQRRCEERERRKKKSAIQCDDFGAVFFACPNGNQWHKILTHQMRMRRCSWEFLKSFRAMFSGGYVTAFASDDGSIRWMYSTYLWISNFSFHTYIIHHTVVGNIPEEEEEEETKKIVLIRVFQAKIFKQIKSNQTAIVNEKPTVDVSGRRFNLAHWTCERLWRWLNMARHLCADSYAFKFGIVVPELMMQMNMLEKSATDWSGMPFQVIYAQHPNSIRVVDKRCSMELKEPLVPILWPIAHTKYN